MRGGCWTVFVLTKKPLNLKEKPTKFWAVCQLRTFQNPFTFNMCIYSVCYQQGDMAVHFSR